MDIKILFIPLQCFNKTQYGSLAEWLGTGLQNRLQQFESARNLQENEEIHSLFFALPYFSTPLRLFGLRPHDFAPARHNQCWALRQAQ